MATFLAKYQTFGDKERRCWQAECDESQVITLCAKTRTMGSQVALALPQQARPTSKNVDTLNRKE
jgi:hypothetical protein